ncbi:hypothetical protein EZ449_21935 [Pedobacter frigidisoli]|uniref:Uncharacterized protein n=1 Tax=Pedobacter frigidisoli TaxID=2530455 RepID=A0A4R0NEA8_9SPHI|nr:hypothetical protein [Pedobacter frigidisoli]TCC97482.1 hypothetical protein EZ449_21935 [Pedobacter frigidisoli]
MIVIDPIWRLGKYIIIQKGFEEEIEYTNSSNQTVAFLEKQAYLPNIDRALQLTSFENSMILLSLDTNQAFYQNADNEWMMQKNQFSKQFLTDDDNVYIHITLELLRQKNESQSIYKLLVLFKKSTRILNALNLATVV